LISARELELRALKKTVTESEEQNATLQKHVERMQQENERMEDEMRERKFQNEMLSQNLNRLRGVLVSSFASLPLPGTQGKGTPNIHNIDKYMNRVKAMQEANSVHFAPFLNKVKDIISRLEL
jgi:predicted RNase H-like nuclease (RuvC/YqgF family)